MNMWEMCVEEAARAIGSETYAYDGPYEAMPGEARYDCGEWEDFGKDAKEVYSRAAIGALGAMLAVLAEPTPEMVEAAICARVLSRTIEQNSTATWQAMLKAIR